MNYNEKFVHEIAQTKDPLVLLGIATILKVELYENDPKNPSQRKPREALSILTDIATNFEKANRATKRAILRTYSKANKKVKPRANRTSNSDTTDTTNS